MKNTDSVKYSTEKALKALDLCHQESLILLKEMSVPGLYVIPDHSWSVSQVVVHLIESEQGSIRYMKKKINSDHLNTAGFGTKFRSFLLLWLLEMPFKFKMPKVLAEPKNNWTIIEMEKALNENISDLGVLMKTISQEKFNKELFKHPVFGKLSFLQTLQFLNSHFNRHLRQMNNIRRIVGH